MLHHLPSFRRLLLGLGALTLIATHLPAEPLKIAYSDWPGFTIFEIAKQKSWFKEAGLDVELVWFDYLPSLDAFSASKGDAVTILATDALLTRANGGKRKIFSFFSFNEGRDNIITK